MEVQGELEGGSGGTCHNDNPGRNDGDIPVTRGHREGVGDCAMCH